MAVRPVMRSATRARMPVVAWRTKTTMAAAPRTSASRKAKKVPEELRPEVYWVVMIDWTLDRHLPVSHDDMRNLQVREFVEIYCVELRIDVVSRGCDGLA